MGLKLVLRRQPHPQFLKWYKTFSWLFGSYYTLVLLLTTIFAVKFPNTNRPCITVFKIFATNIISRSHHYQFSFELIICQSPLHDSGLRHLLFGIPCLISVFLIRKWQNQFKTIGISSSCNWARLLDIGIFTKLTDNLRTSADSKEPLVGDKYEALHVLNRMKRSC